MYSEHVTLSIAEGFLEILRRVAPQNDSKLRFVLNDNTPVTLSCSEGSLGILRCVAPQNDRSCHPERSRRGSGDSPYTIRTIRQKDQSIADLQSQ